MGRKFQKPGHFRTFSDILGGSGLAADVGEMGRKFQKPGHFRTFSDIFGGSGLAAAVGEMGRKFQKPGHFRTFSDILGGSGLARMGMRPFASLRVTVGSLRVTDGLFRHWLHGASVSGGIWAYANNSTFILRIWQGGCLNRDLFDFRIELTRLATKFRLQKGLSRYEIAFNCVTPILIQTTALIIERPCLNARKQGNDTTTALKWIGAYFPGRAEEQPCWIPASA